MNFFDKLLVWLKCVLIASILISWSFPQIVGGKIALAHKAYQAEMMRG